jgi:hypothetical protein
MGGRIKEEDEGGREKKQINEEERGEEHGLLIGH